MALFSSSSSPSPRPHLSRPLEASKWIDFTFLISPNELSDLFDKLAPSLLLYRSRGLYEKGEESLSKEALLSGYDSYLKSSEDSSLYFFLTKESQSIELQIVSDGRLKVIQKLPCLISQPGRLIYSSHDQSVRATTFSQDAIPWGLKWSYPLIYLDPLTRQISRGDRNPPSPNSSLLENLRRWMRENTSAVSFFVDGQKIATPYRLGREWVAHVEKLPALKEKGIKIGLS